METVIRTSVTALLLLAAPGGEEMRLHRWSGRAFGGPVEIEFRAPAAGAEAALQAAMTEILAAQDLTDPAGSALGGIGRLNAAAGTGPQPLEAGLLDLLDRALAFCRWSERAHGPLGGRLYELWGLRQPAAAMPSRQELAAAVQQARCDLLRLDPEAGTGELAAGSRLDLWGFAAGFAVDRATGALRERGVGDARVAVGRVQRAFGSRGEGPGWGVLLPVFPGMASPLEEIRLQGQALAVALATDGGLRAGAESHPPFLDQRTGRPGSGVIATAAVTELAVDAQALAVTMFVTGSRQGQMRLGALRPPPAVLWVLGGGSGPPLLDTYRWSQLRIR